ncbi:unnamed protein product [[Candida] boidinii]|uniref:Unnamed protein product n=1 Tax=Candida boidinii TaxID=5477 RepID=A0ACB5TWJ5_CANBO|nr:unnamed protein product [[Candida] boidinii]GME96765.1 unnamed protein product [[Candida] boidinii]GME97455.1 unnamed protein product [[Candida] boidinii]
MTSLLRRSVAAAKVRPSHALLLTTQSYHANIVHNSYRRFSALNNVTLHENPLGLPRDDKTRQFIPRMSKGLPVKQRIPNVRKILLVSSGKGGVGKSTVAVNVAVGLRDQGLSVGILDADIFGPSVPKLMNLSGSPRLSHDKQHLLPLVNYGIQTMSMGYLIPKESSAIVWRGLMVMKAMQQLLFEVDWQGPLDVLVIDMPPGTGDVQLTLSQQCVIDGAVIVSTSQDVALIDAQKGITMFEKVKIPILGLVENMSYFVCPNCNHEEHIFGENGVIEEAKNRNLEILGSVPLNKEICLQSDKGLPITISDPESKLSQPYFEISKKVKEKLFTEK